MKVQDHDLSPPCDTKAEADKWTYCIIARLCFSDGPCCPTWCSFNCFKYEIGTRRQGMKHNYIVHGKRSVLTELVKVGVVNTFCALLYWIIYAVSSKDTEVFGDISRPFHYHFHLDAFFASHKPELANVGIWHMKFPSQFYKKFLHHSEWWWITLLFQIFYKTHEGLIPDTMNFLPTLNCQCNGNDKYISHFV